MLSRWQAMSVGTPYGCCVHSQAKVTGQHVEAHATACRVLMEGRLLAAFVSAVAERVSREQVDGQRRQEALIRFGVEAGEWPTTTNVSARATLLRGALHGLMATWHVALGSFDWEALAATLAEW